MRHAGIGSTLGGVIDIIGLSDMIIAVLCRTRNESVTISVVAITSAVEIAVATIMHIFLLECIHRETMLICMNHRAYHLCARSFIYIYI